MGLFGGTETIGLAADAMLRIAGGRIATPSVRTGFAMTEVFGSFRTYFAASCIEKHVILSERSESKDPLQISGSLNRFSFLRWGFFASLRMTA